MLCVSRFWPRWILFLSLLDSGGCGGHTMGIGFFWVRLDPLGFDSAGKMPLQRRFRFVVSGGCFEGRGHVRFLSEGDKRPSGL